MSLELLTIILFVSVFALFFAGLPVAFSLAGVAVIGFLLLSGPAALVSIFFSAFNIYMKAFLLVALPLFIFMGHILERSGIAEAMFATIRGWMGPVPGGLAIGTVLICTVMAAMVGIIGAGVVTMSIVAMPGMLSYKYDRRITMGAIMAGGGTGGAYSPQYRYADLLPDRRSIRRKDVCRRHNTRVNPLYSIYNLHSYKMCPQARTWPHFTTRGEIYLEGEICLPEGGNPSHTPGSCRSGVDFCRGCHSYRSRCCRRLWSTYMCRHLPKV